MANKPSLNNFSGPQVPAGVPSTGPHAAATPAQAAASPQAKSEDAVAQNVFKEKRASEELASDSLRERKASLRPVTDNAEEIFNKKIEKVDAKDTLVLQGLLKPDRRMTRHLNPAKPETAERPAVLSRLLGRNTKETEEAPAAQMAEAPHSKEVQAGKLVDEIVQAAGKSKNAGVLPLLNKVQKAFKCEHLSAEQWQLSTSFVQGEINRRIAVIENLKREIEELGDGPELTLKQTELSRLQAALPNQIAKLLEEQKAQEWSTVKSSAEALLSPSTKPDKLVKNLVANVLSLAELYTGGKEDRLPQFRKEIEEIRVIRQELGKLPKNGLEYYAKSREIKSLAKNMLTRMTSEEIVALGKELKEVKNLSISEISTEEKEAYPVFKLVEAFQAVGKGEGESYLTCYSRLERSNDLADIEMKLVGIAAGNRFVTPEIAEFITARKEIDFRRLIDTSRVIEEKWRPIRVQMDGLKSRNLSDEATAVELYQSVDQFLKTVKPSDFVSHIKAMRRLPSEQKSTAAAHLTQMEAIYRDCIRFGFELPVLN